MEYPFRMYGEVVEIYRYQITYTEGEEPELKQVTHGFPTLEEAQLEGNKHGVAPEPLDTTTYEWMEGLTFPTRNDAMAVYDTGEEKCKAQVAAKKEEEYQLKNTIEQLKKQVSDMVPMYSSTDYIPSAMTSMLILSQSSLAQVSDEETKLKVSGLYNNWVAGNHIKGEIYNTHKSDALPGNEWEQTWEVYQAYNNSSNPDIIPGNSSWFTFNRPLHGKTIETARPWVKPAGSHDMYHIEEYMIYTDGFTYKCILDTNFSPEEYAQAWEKQETGGQ